MTATLFSRLIPLPLSTHGARRPVLPSCPQRALFGRSVERLREAASELGLPESQYLLGSTDFTDAHSVQAASDAVMERFGRVDILVHLVGGFTGGKSVVEAASDDVSEMLSQHVWSTFHLAQAFVPHLLANEWGRLIAISSPLAMSPPDFHWRKVGSRSGFR